MGATHRSEAAVKTENDLLKSQIEKLEELVRQQGVHRVYPAVRLASGAHLC